MAKKKDKSDFHMMIKDSKLPILTLDNRWHELFTEEQKTGQIKELEQKVNNLLKKQGKLVNDIKDMKRLKNSLIKDIMANMDIRTDSIGKEKDKKLDKNKQYINEVNDKIDKAMDELGDIPYQIKDINAELVSESIHNFYERLNQNRGQLNELAEWISNIRDELKQKLLLKHDLETSNSMMYTYMHDLLGVELMDILDKEYNYKTND
jgi:seryl-tRNA synthetase